MIYLVSINFQIRSSIRTRKDSRGIRRNQGGRRKWGNWFQVRSKHLKTTAEISFFISSEKWLLWLVWLDSVWFVPALIKFPWSRGNEIRVPDWISRGFSTWLSPLLGVGLGVFHDLSFISLHFIINCGYSCTYMLHRQTQICYIDKHIYAT